MTFNQVAALTTEQIHKHSELMFWSVAFNNKKNAFGTCSHRKKEIQLSSFLIPVMPDEAIKDTILHEIAHALTQGHGHDLTWKRKCVEIGCSPKRTGDDDHFKDGKDGRTEFRKATSKYTLTCPTCGKEYYKNRLPKRIGACASHGSVYNEKHKLILTQNY